jgi:hypothetical protein
MDIFSSNVEQIFSHKFTGLIWRIKFNESIGCIAIESRELLNKKVLFTVFNYKTGQIHFKEKAFAHPLNSNLNLISSSCILLSLNEHIERPETKGLIAVDIHSGKVLWERYNLALHQFYSNAIEVYDPRISPRKLYYIDPISADPITIIPILDDNEQGPQFPQLINEVKIPQLIKSDKLNGDIYYMDYNGKNIFSFHEVVENKMHQRLIVYQGDRTILNEILIQDIQKLQPESFFILSDQMFFIKNKNEIVSYFV